LAAAVVGNLRRAGFPVAIPSGWEDHDATLVGSWMVRGDLVTTAHPQGYVQIRVRRRVRTRRAVALFAGAAIAALITPWLSVAALLVAAGEISRGWYRTRVLVRKVLTAATEG
jgi:hypothetical protein